jgi:hypothetical protein
MCGGTDESSVYYTGVVNYYVRSLLKSHLQASTKKLSIIIVFTSPLLLIWLGIALARG